MKCYRTIVADPPWVYDAFVPSHTPSQGLSWRLALPYPGMGTKAICALPVEAKADTNCRLFLWVTSKYLEDGFRVLGAWGFRYRQALVWHKTGQAQPLPAVVAPNHAEFLLVAQRGKPERIGTLPSSVIAAPRGKHSAKPECFLDYIEQVSPGPYLELFARRNRLGWDTWGNESLEHVELA